MCINTYFVKIVNLFPMLDQIVEDKNTVIDLRFDPIANLPLPLIDWDEEEVNNLDILTKPIEDRTKQWIDEQVAQLKLQGETLTYGELEDEIKSKIDSGTVAARSGETSKSPSSIRSKKRKEVAERQPKHKVYSIKASEGEPSKKGNKLGRPVKMPTIQEDPLHEGEEEEAEQPKSPPSTSALAASTTSIYITPPPASQALLASSLTAVDISIYLASTSPTTPIIVRDYSSSTTSPLSSSSMSPSTAIPLASTTKIPTLTFPKTFTKHMQNIPMELFWSIDEPCSASCPIPSRCWPPYPSSSNKTTQDGGNNENFRRTRETREVSGQSNGWES